MCSLVLVQKGDSFLTPSWKECVQKLAVSSPQICGDNPRVVFSAISNSFHMTHTSIVRKNDSEFIGE